jgi:hypothetical protein
MLNELDLDPVADELPIACKLSGDELAERGEAVDELFKEVEQVRELADGYAFRFSGTAAMASRLLAFTLVERSCCPFFTFELVFEPNEGPIWVRLRGAEGVKEFVASNVGEVIAAHS